MFGEIAAKQEVHNYQRLCKLNTKSSAVCVSVFWCCILRVFGEMFCTFLRKINLRDRTPLLLAGADVVRFKAEVNFDGREITRCHLNRVDMEVLLEVSALLTWLK